MNSSARARLEADCVTLMRLEAAEITDGSRLNGEIKRRTDDGLPASFRESLKA